MKQRAATTSLVRIPDTTLYKPAQLSPDEAMVFLLWDTTAPPATIELSDTWSDSGPPAKVGYYVFLNAIPPNASAKSFESALRADLDAPAATGFVWARYDAPSKAEVQTAVVLKMNGANRPVIADNVTMQLPAGVETLGFGADAPVTASGSIDNFVVAYPPLKGANSPRGPGIRIGISLGSVGCLGFSGLVNVNPPEGERVLKTMVAVQIDPIRPFDPQRTYQVFSGRNYFLEKSGASYEITPAR